MLPMMPMTTSTLDNTCISLSSITLIDECSRIRYALSAAPIPEQVLDRVTCFKHLAVEQMVGAIDDDKLLRIVRACVELLHVFQRAELVALALNEELRLVARPHVVEIEPCHRRRNSDERRYTVVFTADRERPPGAERHAGRPQPDIRIARPHERHGGATVVELSAPFVPRALARPDSAEIESQHGAADPDERLCRLVHDLGVHRAAVLGIRMREHDGGANAIGAPALDESFCVDAALWRRFFEKRFETTGGTGDLTHARRHATSVRTSGATLSGSPRRTCKARLTNVRIASANMPA